MNESRIEIEITEGRTVAGSDYTKPGRSCWRVATFVVRPDGGRSHVDANQSLISAEDASGKAERRAARHGESWLRIHGRDLDALIAEMADADQRSIRRSEARRER